MRGSYVPPFRRHQAAGDSGDAPPIEHSPNNQSPHNNRQRRGGQDGYGGRGGRGNNRGGRGGYRSDFFHKERPQVDESDLYHQRDIDNYFWGEHLDANYVHSSTFRDSKEHPEELSYMLLFFGANPRWANDRIVFAKSKLTLLPEYTAKKAEHGGWETEKLRKYRKASNEEKEKCEPEDKNATVAPADDITEMATQDGGTTPAQTHPLSSRTVENEKQTLKTDKPSSGDETATKAGNTIATGSDSNNEKSQATRTPLDHVKDGEGLSISDVYNDKESKDIVRGIEGHNAKQDKEEDETQATSTLPPALTSSTASGSRFKYSDVRKEEAQDSPAPDSTSSTASTGRMKYTDIRTIPAQEFYNEPAAPVSIFPTIAPIDYVPSNPLLIAVFEERRIPGPRPSSSNHRFAFKGWFKISRVNILAPQSAELVRMLHQKWERKDRFGNFEPLEGEGAPPPPEIERLPGPERPVEQGGEAKGVNELLSEMRLEGGDHNLQNNEDPKDTVINQKEDGSWLRT
ncbi:hypothetical protein F5Y19DRAFT_467446 [Xylariaceae sp. FL1651]|nr:hypothetical protein F5Y19DRAFT_467446 [Xylariaceae sp. FL1651]